MLQRFAMLKFVEKKYWKKSVKTAVVAEEGTGDRSAIVLSRKTMINHWRVHKNDSEQSSTIVL